MEAIQTNRPDFSGLKVSDFIGDCRCSSFERTATIRIKIEKSKSFFISKSISKRDDRCSIPQAAIRRWSCAYPAWSRFEHIWSRRTLAGTVSRGSTGSAELARRWWTLDRRWRTAQRPLSRGKAAPFWSGGSVQTVFWFSVLFARYA